MSSPSHLQQSVHGRPALLQLHRVPLSAWGATGAVEMAGVTVEPSTLQPKLAIFRAFSGGSRWSAAFHNQSVAVSLMTKTSHGHGRSEHVHNSLLYSSFVRKGTQIDECCLLELSVGRARLFEHLLYTWYVYL